ncbi:hypothetical protein [Coriobacterium glomerans]|uniref:hypothetical protein n=1 Tax=Coriobacterium glomerans TaxID=33871 RepID=UPI0005A0B398|nr:hypothetical protein [Coriobacterium glomerans]
MDETTDQTTRSHSSTSNSKICEARPQRGPAVSIASVLFGAASFPAGYLLPALAGLLCALIAIILGVVALKTRSARSGIAKLGISLGILCVAVGCAVIALYLYRASELGLS